MEKYDIRDLHLNKNDQIYNGEGSQIYNIGNGQIVKIAKDIVLQGFYYLDGNYESKIFDSRAKSIKEIISPTAAVYSNNACVGYIMREVSGVDLNSYDKNYTIAQRNNLHEYIRLFRKIEEVVKKANKVGIVMPDLCTCDNIIINNDGSLSFIDYDGMQMGPSDVSICMSTSLGDPMKYMLNPKYSIGLSRFTKELDYTSLTILAFLTIFNIDLNKVGQINPFNNKKVTLKDVFELMGLRDQQLMNKVAANISMYDRGDYIVDDLARVAENYTMTAYRLGNDSFIKKLTHK